MQDPKRVEIHTALAITTLLVVLIVAIWQADTAATQDNSRRVYLGPWAPLVMCESGGNAQATNTSSGADGLWQFLQSTHRWVAEQHNRPKLAEKRPSETTVATQLVQAERLRTMAGGGLSHWVCGGYGTPHSGYVRISGETPIVHPRLCWRKLSRWNLPRKVKTSVCDWTP